MLRLVGAALVAGGTAWLGIRASAALRQREQALRNMAQGLRLLEQELELSAQPLARLLEMLLRRGDGPAKELAKDCLEGLNHLADEDFSTLWRKRVMCRRELGEEGQRCLLPLGDTLGRYDSREQCRTICLVRNRLEELAGQAGEECRRQGRVYSVLGLSAGAFLIILLL